MSDHQFLLSCVRRSLYHIKATYQQFQFKIMVDSGAQNSIISYKMMQHLGLSGKLDKKRAGTAQGVGQAKIYGMIYDCQITIDNTTIDVNFHVMDTSLGDEYMVLFGLDILESHECIINFKTKTLTLSDTIIKFMNEAEINQHSTPLNLHHLQLQQYLDIINNALPLNKSEATKTLIKKIITNIIDHPRDNKYKSVNLNNKQVQECIIQHDVCMELVKYLGFSHVDGTLRYVQNDLEQLHGFNELLAY